MPRRKKGIDGATMGLILVVGIVWLIATGISNAVRSPDGWIVIAVVAGVIVLIIMLKAAAKKRKLEYLTGKYRDETIVAKIYHHRFWEGQTAEQLLDSLGKPHAMDDKLLKTRKREVWKYNRTGVNRYGLRITLDNDIVTTWDHKH
jgi:hypothetical protein